ncbi:MAG: hypothetical protein HKM04_08250 [Legionellales bacterium]|nr:hypothetical protein [Legionellales bacterium]
MLKKSNANSVEQKATINREKVYNYLFDKVDQFTGMLGDAMGYETTITAAFRDHYKHEADAKFPLIIKEPSDEIVQKYKQEGLKLKQASKLFISVLPMIFDETNPEECFYNSRTGSLWQEDHNWSTNSATFSFTQRGFDILLAHVQLLETKRNASKVSEVRAGFHYNPSNTSPVNNNNNNYLDYLDDEEKAQVIVSQQRHNG